MTQLDAELGRDDDPDNAPTVGPVLVTTRPLQAAGAPSALTAAAAVRSDAKSNLIESLYR